MRPAHIYLKGRASKRWLPPAPGIAYSLGYCDGQEITIDDLEYAVGKMADRISVPLSVDVERGYGETGRQVKENIRRLLRAGAVRLQS